MSCHISLPIGKKVIWALECDMQFLFYHISSTMGFCKWLHWYTLHCWLAKITIAITIIWMTSWLSSPPYGWYHWLVLSSWISWEDLQVAGETGGIAPSMLPLWSKDQDDSVDSKHCQRHNGPEDWVDLTKVTSWGHITNSNTNLDQSSFSESRPSINLKISTKHQHLD